MKKMVITVLVLVVIGIGFYIGYQKSLKSNLAKDNISRDISHLGQLSFKEWNDGTTLVRLRKEGGITFDILYSQGTATDITVFHPQNHPLKNKIQPAPNRQTLQLATRILPTLLALAKAQQDIVTEDVNLLFQDFPEHLYSLPFKKTTGRYRLLQDEMIFLQGTGTIPNTQYPVIIYWGPDGADEIGNDLLYCGLWKLNKTSLNLPVEFPPNSHYKIQTGDVIQFMGCKLFIERIEHDGDGLRGNNRLFLQIKGLADYSKVKSGIGSGGRSIFPQDFIREVCFPTEPDNSVIETQHNPYTLEEIQGNITRMAYATNNADRANVVKEMLREMDFGENDIQIAPNNANMEDFWVKKEGNSKEVAIIATYYDKTGNGSQGVIDNGVGVVVTLGLAKALKQTDTKLTYIFLFYGGEEINHNYYSWLQNQSVPVRESIRYLISVKGCGLRGCKRTLNLERKNILGWLHWSFPVLNINSTGGESAYQKHTAKDNLSFCDFNLVKETEDSILEWIMTIEKNL